jgi:excinuclease UvrABC ATPase subunit
MLHMVCEYCQGTGIRDWEVKISDMGMPEISEVDSIICDICSGTGYHRNLVQSEDGVRRWSVLRVLDLIYVEHKHRERITTNPILYRAADLS